MKLLEMIFHSFWSFIGFLILIATIGGGILNFIFICWNRFLRHLNIRKQGWPPSHIDADGDFPTITEEENN